MAVPGYRADVPDESSLQEILRSPLDDMPERSMDPRRALLGAALVALVLGLGGFVLLSGDDGTVPDTPGAATTVADGDGATSAPGGEGGDVTTTVAPTEETAPEANGGFHEMVAIGDGEMLLFGGFIGLDNGTAPFEGTWRFDVIEGSWSVEDPGIAPSPRYGHAMAFHPPTGKVVVFGGGATTPRPCPRIRTCPGPEDNEVWQYDPATGIWEDMTPPDTEAVVWPTPRFGMRFAYEPITERLITFGGAGVFGENFTPNFWNDTWAYDPATNTWEDLSDPDEESRPHVAVEYGLVWNEDAGRVLMFGGDGIPGDPESLFAFDPETATWEDLGTNDPGEGPKDRWFHTMVADPQTGRTVVIGGNGSIYRIISGGTIRENGNLDEVWTWSPAEGWVAMNPLERDIVAVAAAGDPGSLGIIVYGGDDVLSYDAAVDAWSVIWDRPDEDDT
jgi:hypothetical protein